MHPKSLALTTLNWFEQQDKDTIKQLCVSCGGKGYYLLVSMGNTKGIITPCEECEDGFKYKTRLKEDNGKE